MLLTIHPENPQERLIKQAVDCLQSGGIILYPTDTIYGLGCSIFDKKAIEKIARLKKISPEKAQFSFICDSLSDLSRYTKSIETPLYRLLKKLLPGPYTFILPANKEVPKLLYSKKKTIGLRIPDNKIALALVRTLGHPILSASLPDDMMKEGTEPSNVDKKLLNDVDIIIDGGIIGNIPSTIIDTTTQPYTLVRQGLGKWDEDNY